jgi:hypothetical protein
MKKNLYSAITDDGCYIIDSPSMESAPEIVARVFTTDEPEKTTRLLAAASAMYAACEAADALCAVLNISDLTPQARGAVREAWPLIQEAITVARPNSQYATAIKDAHQHEIKRLDGIIWTLIEAIRITRVQSPGPDWTKEQAFDFIRDHAKATLNIAAEAGFDYRTRKAKADAAAICHYACGHDAGHNCAPGCTRVPPREDKA